MSSKLSREELITLVDKLLRAEGSEEEQAQWLRTVEENVPHPEVSDLIYHPEVPLTSTEIVEIALNYRGIRLG
jgi:hypothetical protein